MLEREIEVVLNKDLSSLPFAQLLLYDFEVEVPSTLHSV